MTKAKKNKTHGSGRKENKNAPKVLIPCEDSQDVYRTLFSGTYDHRNKRINPVAYFLRESDKDGVSLAFSTENARTVSPKHCIAVAKSIVLDIRAVCLENGDNAGVDVMKDSPTHAYISGLPMPPLPPQIGLAHFLAGQIAKASHPVWVKDEENE